MIYENELRITKEKPISGYYIYIDKDFVDEITKRGYQFNEWLRSSVNYCLFIEQGRVFQEIGKDKTKMKLTMNDLLIYQKSSKKDYIINIPRSLVNEIYEVTGKYNLEYIDKWMRKVLYLGSVLDYMNLFYKTDSGYFKIKF